MYSEKATKLFQTSILDLSYVVMIKSTVEISHNFVSFSEYMNFTYKFLLLYADFSLHYIISIDVS